MRRTLLLVAAVGLLLAADDKNDAAKKEVEKLQGTWTTATLEYNGKAKDDLAKQLRFVFKGDAATVEGNDEVRKEYATFRFKLDPSTSPKCVDLTITGGVQKDAVIEGIYELNGDELKICAKVLGKERPTKFASPEGSSVVLLVLKRDKR